MTAGRSGLSRTRRAASLAPVSDPDARVLVLGSLPGRRSLAAGEYYAHPQNAFWPIMAALAGAGPDLPYRERLARLRAAGIALWDVLASGERPGSLDTSIRPDTAVPNDLPGFLAAHPRIVRICFNGQAAARLFRRLVGDLPRPARCTLPSTSPAHAAMSRDAKLAAWADGLRPAMRIHTQPPGVRASPTKERP